MSERTRRGILALGAGALAAVAGCLGGDPAGETTTDGESERTDTVTDRAGGSPTPTGTEPVAATDSLSFDYAAALHRRDAPYPERDVAEYYLALLASDEHASAFPVDRFSNADARAFVAETDYPSSVVVVLQDRRGSSHPDLELVGASLGDDGVLAVDARYAGEGATADITTDTLLVRVATGGRPVEAARASISPQYGEAERLATEAAYAGTPAFDSPGDFVVRNRDCVPRDVGLTVTYDGDLFLQRRPDLAPASNRRIENLFTRPGEWRVSVRVADETVSKSVTLSEDPPGDVLARVTGRGSASVVHRPDGVAGPTAAGCETVEYPYESAEPAENLADAVDLWVLDHSESAHSLRVTIRDGETTVFSGEFQTREGYAKARRANLLGKKTTYTVEVSTESGQTLTESVTVDDGVSKLTVRVTESGELAVSVN